MSRWKELQSNPEKKELLIKRSHLINQVREFFLQYDFIECDTPELVKYPGLEPYLTPFETTISDVTGKNHTAYLITSPEYSMKKILATGLDKIFQISKVFRNMESFGGTHNPEFTMIEWYRAHANYKDIMQDTEKLILHLVNNASHKSKIQNPKSKITYQNQIIDLTIPWPRMTVAEAFEHFASIK